MKTAIIERPTCASCPYFENFGEPNRRGWCSAFDQMARLDHERTKACEQEIEALNKEAQQKAEQEPVSFGEDLVVGLQLTTESTTEFEQGRLHGRNDALAGWHPIYKEPSTQYARGYLSGYNETLNPPTPQLEASLPLEWSITYNSQWDWYDVWVGSKWVGRASSESEAERIAQRYIATNEMIRRQNAAVLKAYAA